MKRHAVSFFVILISLVLVLDAAANNNAVITGSGVRIRPAPSINTGIISEVNAGTRVEVLAHTDFTESIDGFTGYWYYVNYKGIYGYVFGKYIRTDTGTSIPSESDYFAPGD